MAGSPHGKHSGNHASQQSTPQSGVSSNPYSRTNAHYSAKSGAHGASPLPGSAGVSAYSRNSANYSSKKRGMSRGKKIALGVVCVLLVCMVGVGVAGALYLNGLNNTLQGDMSDEQRTAIAEVTDPTTNFDKPFYMLLVGSDARVDDPSSGQRSDTNILAYVDPVNNVVSMVSIPRDTMIEIDGNMEKFNAAYSYKGAASTIKEANELCGVKISHYAEVNFEKLVQLIDAVGGVEVDVPELIDDPDAGNVVIQPGLQTLNGEAALTFARSRAYADGDFTRTSNQRLLVEALVKKVLATPVTDLPNVIQRAAECVTTDLSATEIVDLATRFQDGGITMYSAMVPSTTATVGGVSYVLTYQTQLEEMMKLVEEGKDPSTVNMTGTQADIRKEQQDLMGTSGGSVYYEDPATSPTGAASAYSYTDTSDVYADTTETYAGTYSETGGYSDTYNDAYSDVAPDYSGGGNGYGGPDYSGGGTDADAGAGTGTDAGAGDVATAPEEEGEAYPQGTEEPAVDGAA